MRESLTGRLLVATPLLEGRHFRRAVVLVCSHSDAGAYGVVLNHPLPEPVGSYLREWSPYVADPPVFFGGGPVQPATVIALGRDPSGVVAPWWTRVTPQVGLLDLKWQPADVAPTVEAVRLFAGYAGWSLDQIEAEVAQQAWWIIDSAPGDAFASEPEALWREVLRRQRSPLAMFSTYPTDLALN